MYRSTSNRSGDLNQQIVATDLIKRGWIVLTPSSRDSVYDFVVDMGDKIFHTIQVKTMSSNSISKFIDRSGERVSFNGKTRNSLDYAEHKIDWIVGVNKKGEVFYYHLNTYSKIPSKSFSVKIWKPDCFPINEQIKSNCNTQHKEKES